MDGYGGRGNPGEVATAVLVGIDLFATPAGPALINKTGVSNMCDQAQIINAAGREWDSHPQLQSMTSREAYCEDAIRESKKRETYTNSVPLPAGSDRGTIINAASGEWDSHPQLQRITSRAAYVTDALRQNGQSPLAATERSICGSRRHGSAGLPRATIIANAAREFDSQPALQKLTSRAAYINLGLRDQGLCQIVNAYTYASDGTPMSSEEREKMLRMFADRWHKDADIQDEIDLADFVDESLEANLLPRMTAEERADMMDGSGSQANAPGSHASGGAVSRHQRWGKFNRSHHGK